MMTFDDSRNASLVDLPVVMGFPLLEGASSGVETLGFPSHFLPLCWKSHHSETVKICWFAAQK